MTRLLTFPFMLCVFRLALWEGSVGMEKSIGMLIFKLFAIQGKLPGTPSPLYPSFLLYCTSLCPHSLQETGVGPSHHLGHIQASVAFFPLEMSLGSVGALIEFVAYKVPLRSNFLTGGLILYQPEGVMGTVTG